MKINYTQFSGRDWSAELAFVDGAGTFIDTSTYNIYFTLKTNKYDADSAKVYQQMVHGSNTTGKATVGITGTQSASLSGTYYYDISYKGATNEINSVQSGVFTFTQPIQITVA